MGERESGIFQGRLFGGKKKVGSVSGGKEKQPNRRKEKKLGTHIVPSGTNFMQRWGGRRGKDGVNCVARESAYCDRLNRRLGDRSYCAVRLKEPLKALVGGRKKTISTGSVIYTLKRNIPRA